MTPETGRDASAPHARPGADRMYQHEPGEPDLLLLLTASLTILRRNWIAAAIVFVLTLGGVVAASLIMTPLWRVEIVVMPVKDSDPGALSALASGIGLLGASVLGGGDSRSAEALAILRSRELFDEYAREKNLLPLLYDDLWDPEQGAWKVEPARVPTLRQAFRLFDGGIREIEENRLTGMVTLSIIWKDREQAVIWAREIIALTNRQLRDRAAADAMQNIEYLNQEMRTASGLGAQNALSAALASAYEDQLQNYMFARGQDEYAFRVIDPPTVPDEDEVVSPRRVVMAVIGALLGGLLAIFAAFAAHFYRTARGKETA